ncbi:MAG: hypothetical protein ACYC7E_11790 [Armatimonadota bacterium]
MPVAKDNQSMNEEEKIGEVVEEEEHGHPFWPTHVLNQVNILYVVGVVLITLSILLPWHLHGKADPMHTPEGIKPEWYFLSAYQFLKYVPKTFGIMVCGVAVLLVVIWPFIDPLLDRRFGVRAYRWVGGVGLFLFLFFGFLGWICETKMTIFGRTYEFDLRAIPHRVTHQEKDTEDEPSSSHGASLPDSGSSDEENSTKE